MQVVSRAMTVRRPEGLHARPAARFVEIARRHPGAVEVEADGRRVNAKSILSILQLGVRGGQTIVVRAEGPGAEELLGELAALVEAEQ